MNKTAKWHIKVKKFHFEAFENKRTAKIELRDKLAEVFMCQTFELLIGKYFHSKISNFSQIKISQHGIPCQTYFRPRFLIKRKDFINTKLCNNFQRSIIHSQRKISFGKWNCLFPSSWVGGTLSTLIRNGLGVCQRFLQIAPTSIQIPIWHNTGSLTCPRRRWKLLKFSL